jgi:hypothetical protein
VGWRLPGSDFVFGLHVIGHVRQQSQIWCRSIGGRRSPASLPSGWAFEVDMGEKGTSDPSVGRFFVRLVEFERRPNYLLRKLTTFTL